jgi:adenylate cyclase
MKTSNHNFSLFTIRFSLLFIIFNTSFSIAIAQQSRLDSLLSVWEDKNQTDSTRVAAYNFYIGYGFIYSQPDTAFLLAEKLIAFGKKKSYPIGEAKGLNLQGFSHMELGNYPKALDYFNRSLKISEEIGSNHDRSNAIGNIGNLYSIQGNNAKALKYFNRSVKIKEKLGDIRTLAIVIANIGSIYFTQKNYPRALEYFNRALIINEEIEEKQGIAGMMGQIGSVYIKQGKYPQALEIFNRSLVIAEKIGFSALVGSNLHSIGKIYGLQDNAPKSLEFYNRSLKIITETGNRNYISQILYGIGSLHLKRGKTGKALEYCAQGLKVAEEIGALEPQKNNCQCLYDTYRTMRMGNEALVYMEKMNVIRDSLHSDETSKQLQQMEFAKQVLQDSIAQAETDRLVLEAHQEELNAEEKTRNIGFGIGGLVLLLAVGLYSRLRYVRKSKAIIEEEKDRSNNLLLNILPADIAEELKIHGKAEARDFDMVSILFTDFKGFTAASEKLSAQELVAEINTCFEAFDGIMTKYGIEKIKTIGDAYMAAGGLPLPTDDSVKNSVLAALEMQAFIGKRKSEMDAAGKPAFEMRVGIHTGPVVAGIVGVKKFQYDIWGDTVNTAARMESSGEVAKVNISQATYELLKDDRDFAFESRGKIEAKGKGEIEMYFVSLKTNN